MEDNALPKNLPITKTTMSTSSGARTKDNISDDITAVKYYTV